MKVSIVPAALCVFSVVLLALLLGAPSKEGPMPIIMIVGVGWIIWTILLTGTMALLLILGHIYKEDEQQ
jgi:hypothetical protein